MAVEQDLKLIEEIDAHLAAGDNLAALRVFSRALAIYMPTEKFTKLAGFIQTMGWVSWSAKVASQTAIFTDDESANVFSSLSVPVLLKRRCVDIMGYHKGELIACHRERMQGALSNDDNLSALKNYVAILIISDDGCDFSSLMRLAARLEIVGWSGKSAEDLLLFSIEEWDRILANPLLSDELKHAFLSVIGFGLKSAHDWNACFFDSYCAPALRALISGGKYNLARRLAIETQLGFAWQPHTEEHAAYCYSAYARDLALAARKERVKVPGAEMVVSNVSTLKIAFFMDFGFNNSSPIGLLLDILAPITSSPSPAITPVIYAFSGCDPITVNLFDEVGIEVINVAHLRGAPLVDDDFVEQLRFAQSKLALDGIRAVVYCHSSDFFGTFCAAFRMAPVQVLWTMTHHFADLPELDRYISSGGAWHAIGRNIGTKYWHTLPVCMNPEFVVKHLQHGRSSAERIRVGEFGGEVIVIGSIARPEKIDSDAYFDVVSGVIKACPNVIFVWFGNAPLPSVSEKIRQRGIERHCVFRGWVDPTVYAQVLDIHLDTIPYQNGISMRLSMAAGTAMVLYDGGNAAGNLSSEILPAYMGEFGVSAQQAMRDIFSDEQGRSLLFCATAVDEYIAYVKLLVEDPQLRASAGRAARKFAEHYTFNQESVANLLVQHLCTLIDQD